jgi:hypothetical protein
MTEGSALGDIEGVMEGLLVGRYDCDKVGCKLGRVLGTTEGVLEGVLDGL